jgi:hypothetical protein
MPLTERQRKAALLTSELTRLPGVWVISPSPLNEDARGLRVQILNKYCHETIETLREANWVPSLIGSYPRIAASASGLEPANLYEIAIEKERQPVVDNIPKVSGEITKREKTPAEVEHMRRYLGWSK